MDEPLHTLNAARVLAEFWVVHTHALTHIPGSITEAKFDVVQDLMCFFFVLSGFVVGYSARENEPPSSFWTRRFVKCYPIYALFLLIDLPLMLWHQGLYPLAWLCMASDFVGIAPWLGCGSVVQLNSSSWYLATLASLWFIAPYLLSWTQTQSRMQAVRIIGAIFLVSLTPFYFITHLTEVVYNLHFLICNATQL